MRRGLIAALVVVLCAFGLAQGGPETWAQTTAERAVRIASIPCDTNLQSSSTGVVIDDRTVLTVAHAIFESRVFAVRDHAGRWHSGEVVRLDLAQDLAVVRIDDIRAAPMPLAAPRAVAAWPGVSVQMLNGARSGTVDSEIVRRVNISTEVIGDLSTTTRRFGYEVALDIKPGDSGSAIVDTDGSLVGVVFAQSTTRPAAWATAADVDQIDLSPAPVATWDCRPDASAALNLSPPGEPEADRLAG